MSGKKPTIAAKSDEDQRSHRTRKALLDSLIDLVHGRRYDEVAVGDIVEGAKVARSTFYDHYRGKDDMIVETMGGMLDVMADVASGEQDVLALELVLRHFNENKTFARQLFTSAAGRDVMLRISRQLSELIEERLKLRTVSRPESSLLPLSMIASQLAESQFALVKSWLAADTTCTSAELARAIQRSASGSIAALLGD